MYNAVCRLYIGTDYAVYTVYIQCIHSVYTVYIHIGYTGYNKPQNNLLHEHYSITKGHWYNYG